MIPGQNELDTIERDLRFHPVVNDAPKTLSREQIARFNRDGYIQPIRIFDDVVVGNDISIGRNNYAAADAVLDLRLRPAVRAKSLAKARTEELLHVVRDLLLFGHVRFTF